MNNIFPQRNTRFVCQATQLVCPRHWKYRPVNC